MVAFQGRMKTLISGAKSDTSFGTTTSQKLTTFLGGHSGAKAMGAGAFEYAGLKCTFHDNSWRFIYSKLIIFPVIYSLKLPGKRERGFYRECEPDAISWWFFDFVWGALWDSGNGFSMPDGKTNRTSQLIHRLCWSLFSVFLHFSGGQTPGKNHACCYNILINKNKNTGKL